MNYFWDDWGSTHALYYDEYRRIVGEVKECWRRHVGWARGKEIGEFLDKKSAQQAVERAIKATEPATINLDEILGKSESEPA